MIPSRNKVPTPVDVASTGTLQEQVTELRAALTAAVEARERAERELNELAARHRLVALLVESTDHSIIAYDIKGFVTFWNRAAERLYGFDRGEAMGMSIEAIVPPERRQEFEELRAKAANGEHVHDFQTVRMARDGRRVHVSITVTPTYDADGIVTGFSGIGRDVSERIQSERALELRTLELETSNADLQDFAYAASHDLQEPLRAVAGYCQLLATNYRGKLDERADEFIDFAVDGSRRMKRLIDDLLLFSRLGPRTMLTAVDLNHAVDDALQNLQTALTETGTRVEVSDLPMIPGDPSRLVQLFQNLIGNAIKFRGAQPLVVRIDASVEGAGHLIRVSDNGIGFEPTHAERIFKMFQRLHPQGRYEGTGIGLALCRRIVMQHGGRIWATSAPGAGSTFSFTVSTNEEPS